MNSYMRHKRNRAIKHNLHERTIDKLLEDLEIDDDFDKIEHCEFHELTFSEVRYFD